MTIQDTQFPPNAPSQTWLLTAAASPLGIKLARALLSHGDSVVLGVEAPILEESRSSKLWPENYSGRAEELGRFIRDEIQKDEGWIERSRVVPLNGSTLGQCQIAVAETVKVFGTIDVLFCCANETVIGTIEELAASQRTLTVVRDQFETNFFGPINMIKTVLPTMRAKRNGHIIVLTGITSHLGTPGMGIHCASGWAVEGFCDSLAYEIAPFNIKMTIVQPNLEVNVLTNKITAVPILPPYSPYDHPAPLARSVVGGLLDRIYLRSDSTVDGQSPAEEAEEAEQSHFLSPNKTETFYPHLQEEMETALLAETIHALTAIGGLENPPARHIVGFEGVASVKEKLKTVSEELEDFVEVSSAVDIEEKVTPLVAGEGK